MASKGEVRSADVRLLGKYRRQRADGEGLQRRVEIAPTSGHFDLLQQWWAVAVLGLVVFVWLAATAWVRPLTLPDEGRYVGVAWEMVRSGNWLVPTLDTLPFFHKPPLFYWLTAGAISMLGNNAWAARLPTLLSATAAVLALFLFLRRWANGTAALAAVLILPTMPFFFAGAQFANLDMLVAVCITGSILCAAHVVLSWRHEQCPRRLALAGAYILAALGLLAKGLIAIVIPALIIGIWLVLTRDLRMILRLLYWPGVTLFALIAVPWFASMQARYAGFLDYFFVHHHVERYLTGGFNGKQSFWFYAPLFAVITLPWCAFLPWTLGKQGENKVASDLRLLHWIWLATTLIFFSIPKSKLVGYVLPATPALAALVAQGIASHTGSWIGSRLNVIANATVAALVCVVGMVGFAVHQRHGIEQLAAELRAQIRPGDQLLAISQYPFSLAFYLRAKQPIIVIEDWDAESIQQRDNWRKELYEGAKFAPERGSSLLLRPTQLEAALCAGRTWVFGSERDVDRLADLRRIGRNTTDLVWFADPDQLRCPPAAR
jgi:4-amino-4-deoxy-L-arabinose transferase-like glycosyltransferase